MCKTDLVENQVIGVYECDAVDLCSRDRFLVQAVESSEITVFRWRIVFLRCHTSSESEHVYQCW